LGGITKEFKKIPARSNVTTSESIKGAVGFGRNKQNQVFYPQEISPGGWNILGNSSVPIFDPKKGDTHVWSK